MSQANGFMNPGNCPCGEEAVRDQAAEWFARACDAPLVPEQQAQLQAWLAQHPAVATVIHPSLQTGEAKRRADAYLRGGYGSLIGFELKGGVEAGKRFIDALKMFYHVANIGDARSLAIHPASTTHSQLSEEEQRASGVTPGYVRLSIGIEHIDDIIADLDQALEAVSGRLQAAAQ